DRLRRYGTERVLSLAEVQFDLTGDTRGKPKERVLDLAGVLLDLRRGIRRGGGERALGILSGQADRVGCRGGQFPDPTLGVRRVGLDHLRELLNARVDDIGSGLAAHLDLGRRGVDAVDQQVLETTDAGVEVAGDFRGAVAQYAVDLGGLGVERVCKLGAAR